MSTDFYIRLYLAVYRVTELFPDKEALKNDIRISANEILVDLINNHYESTSRSIDNLNGLFDLAGEQNWVDKRNFLVLSREYNKIQRLINAGKTVENSFSKKRGFSPKTQKRKEKILELLKENNKIKLGDLTKVFPNINRRTLIRDLENLNQVSLVAKNGNGRGIYYTVRNVT